METKVSVSTDLAVIVATVPLSSMHDYAPLGTVPPLPPPSPLGVAAEVPVTIYWPPGALMGKNKLTSTVYHGGRQFALEGHDCGPAIIHCQVAPAPPNVMTVLHILKSSRKANFSAGEVKANGKPIAHCILTWLPPTPMTSCGSPLAIPGTDTPTAHLNSLIIGVTWVDLIAGWLSIAVSMVFGLLNARGAKAPGATSIGGALSGEVRKWAGGAAGGGANGGFGAHPIQSNISANVTGLTRLAGQFLTNYHGDGGVTLTASNGFWKAGSSFTRSGEDGRVTAGVFEGVQGPMGIGGAQVAGTVSGGGGEPVDAAVRGTGNVGGATASGGGSVNDGLSGAANWPSI